MKKLILSISLVSALVASTALASEPEPRASKCEVVCINGRCMTCCTYGSQGTYCY